MRRPRLNRGMLVGLKKIEHGLLRSLERDPQLVERVNRLLAIPGIGPVTALSWVLEVGEVKRFTSVKEVISYCGLCADERNSAGVAKRGPLRIWEGSNWYGR